MKTGAGTAFLLLGLALLPAALAAGEGGEPTKPPMTRVQHQLQMLIRAEAGLPAGPAVAAEAVATPAVAEEILELEPMVIEEQKLKDLPPPETKAEKFFRTGTVWEKVGPRFTRRFWIKGDRGILFTLSW